MLLTLSYQVPRTRNSHKLAEASDANFGVQRRHQRDKLAGVLIDFGVRTRAQVMLTDFGTLVGAGCSMSVRWSLLCASVLTAGLLGLGEGIAEELGPEQARAFVVGKLFTYTCFEGTSGMGRIYSDGSVVGTIKIRGQGQTRFAALPAGTIRVDGGLMCAHLAGMPFTPCFRVEKIDYRSFRGSLAGLSFAYCDFYQRNPRSHLISSSAEQSTAATTPVANVRPALRPSLPQ